MQSSPKVRGSGLDRALKPLHRWVWRDRSRRARKLLSFARTEADGGRDLARAAEVTSDGLLRRLYLRHAADEQRHADLFRRRAHAILAELPPRATAAFEANWFAPGERGLDDLEVAEQGDGSLLAFLHLSEKAAAGRFAVYRDVLADDAPTRDVFATILRDEAFHMNYTRSQLTRVAPTRHRATLWRARASRLWKSFVRIMAGLGAVIGTVVLLVQYFVLLPVFALLAKRSARRAAPGWTAARPLHAESRRSLYS